MGNSVNTICMYFDDIFVNCTERLVCSRMRVSRINLVILFAFFVTLSFPAYAYADDAVIGRTPEGVYPMMDTEVEMTSESIIVDLDRSEVECTFTFLNTGEAREVSMGFPGKLNEDMGSMFSDDVSLSLSDFRAYVNGVEIPVEKEKGVQPEIDMPFYNEWYTFTVPFGAEETVTVNNTYTYQPSYNSIGDVFTGYVLQTGATWKGRIGKARVEFKLGSVKPWQIEQLRPGGFRFEGNSIIWERSSIEPTYDLEILYNTWHYSDEFLEMMEANNEDASTILSKIDKYREIKELADKNDTEGLLAEYAKAEQSRDTVLAVYIAGFTQRGRAPDYVPKLGDISVRPYGTTYNIRCAVQSLYTPNTRMRISHLEGEELVIDHESANSSIYIILKPEVEYSISFVARDWLNRTAEKELKFLVPPGGAEAQAELEEAAAAKAAEAAEAVEGGGADGMAEATEGTDKKDGALEAAGTSEEGSRGTDGAKDAAETEKAGSTAQSNTTEETGTNDVSGRAVEAAANKAVRPGTGISSMPVANDASGNDSMTPMQASKGGSRTFLWVIGVIGALGCLAAGFFAYTLGKSKNKV